MLENMVLTEKKLVIVDTDAGIEHFGRGMEQGCDIIADIDELAIFIRAGKTGK